MTTAQTIQITVEVDKHVTTNSLQLTEIDEMNLFYHLEFSITIFTVIVSLYQVVNAFDIQTQNHSRYKRVYNGEKLSDGKFPYVVFLKYLDHPKRMSDPCIEKVCTGTLVHRRYVLTLNSCLDENLVTTLRVSKIIISCIDFFCIMNINYLLLIF